MEISGRFFEELLYNYTMLKEFIFGNIVGI